MAATIVHGTPGSRLGQMKARFQQKQLQEKEEKMLRLYETQQQRTMERVQGRTSAGGSSGTTSPGAGSSGGSSVGSQGGGRVRQMFDERRTNGRVGGPTANAAGIDKSYPLDPINAKHNSHGALARGASLDRYPAPKVAAKTTKSVAHQSKFQTRERRSLNTTTTTTTANTFASRLNQAPTIYTNNNSNNNNNRQQPAVLAHDNDYCETDGTVGGTADDLDNDNDPTYMLKRQQRDLEHMLNKHNLYESLDDEDFPDVQLIDDDLEVTFGKLPNVGRVLPSERILPPAKQQERPVARNNSKLMPPKRTSMPAAPRKPMATIAAAGDASTKNVRKSPVHNGLKRKESDSHKSHSVTQIAAPSTTSRKPKPPASTTASVKSARSMQQGNAGASSAKGPSARSRVAGAPAPGPPGSGVARDDLQACKFCNRRFATDRLGVHQEICARTVQKKRKPYDALKHRVLGTEAEMFVRKAMRSKSQPKPQALKKSDWRKKHEDFVQTIRAAKQMQAHVAAGGKLSDLPPPPPSYNPDYVQCPHCGRRFNQAAAERHIPKCANYVFNKPGPAPASKKR